MCRADILILKPLKPTYENICDLALAVGFDACGVAPVRFLYEDAHYLNEWIAQGLHGDMSYLERNCDKRYDPSVLVPGSKMVIVCLLTYEHSGRDYHRKIKSMLYALEALLKDRYGDEIVSSTHQHIFCDSAPILERRWCVEAGLGFIGKNHQLIHPTLGSMVHPGEIVINVTIEEWDNAKINDLQLSCGDCMLCLNACPTCALLNEVWDVRKCVAYETHHCLVCQIVCPYNK